MIVSNAAMPQVASYASAAIVGFGLIISSAVTPQGQANASEYQHGTHAQAIAQAENVKSSIRPSVRTPPAAATPLPQKSLWAAPDLVDLSISGWSTSGQQAPQGPVPPTISAGQSDPSQIPAQVWKSSTTQVVSTKVQTFVSASPQTEDRPTQQVLPSQVSGKTTRLIAPTSAAPQLADLTQQAVLSKPLTSPQGPTVTPLTGGPLQVDLTQQALIKTPPTQLHGAVPPVTQGAPQLVDLTLQAQLSKPLTTPQGQVPPSTFGVPQSDTTQTAAVVIASQPAAPIVANPVAPSFTVPPQTEDRPTTIIWPSQFSGKTPPVITSLWASPQSIDLTQQASIVAPSIVPPVVSYALTPLYASPQLVDLTIQGWVNGTPLSSQGPVPPLTLIPLTELLQTGGFQPGAVLFPASATPPTAPPNLHKLYMDVTTGKLYWQVSQTSNPILILPL